APVFDSSRRRHTRSKRDWSSDVCSSDLVSITIQLIQTLHKLLPSIQCLLVSCLKVTICGVFVSTVWLLIRPEPRLVKVVPDLTSWLTSKVAIKETLPSGVVAAFLRTA